ncbi:MAG TPA: hypothetical protein VGH33_22035, partial [Isosphaeraceae bacterium]
EDTLTWIDRLALDLRQLMAGIGADVDSGLPTVGSTPPGRANVFNIRPFECVGVGPFGLVALIASALRNDRVSRVGWIGPLVSFVGADAMPWTGLPMGLIAPDVLDVADVGHLAALVAPKPLVLAGGVEPSGVPASAARRAEAFGYARAAYRLLGAPQRLTLLDSADVGGFARALAAADAT